MGITLGVVAMVFEKFIIYFRFICKAAYQHEFSMHEVTGEGVDVAISSTEVTFVVTRTKVSLISPAKIVIT